MQRTAARFAGAAALSGLLAAVAVLPSAGTASAAPPSQWPAEVRGGAAALPPGGCEDEPQQGATIKHVPPVQQMLAYERVWSRSQGEGVTIAVLDSGVDVSHPQLKDANIATGADFLRGKGGGTGRRDCDGHGTAVTSLIAAQKVNGVAFQGLAYQSKILPVVVSDEHDDKEGTTVTASGANFAKAVDWAVKNDADVIHISLAMSGLDAAVEQAIHRAVEADVVVVAAAGDRAKPADAGKGIPANPGPTPYPAQYDGVIGVGAVAWGKEGGLEHLPRSQWGSFVDLSAPGSVIAANRDGKHYTFEGTAYATAFVSAAAALVRSKWPQMTADEVERWLLATASPPPGSRDKVGHGIVNPYRALTEGLSGEQPAPAGRVKMPSPDAATAARAAEWSFAGTVALVTAAIGVLVAGGTLATLSLLPRGIRRRWRPGRAKSFPPPREGDGDLPPAPVQLFEDLEAR